MRFLFFTKLSFASFLRQLQVMRSQKVTPPAKNAKIAGGVPN